MHLPTLTAPELCFKIQQLLPCCWLKSKPTNQFKIKWPKHIPWQAEKMLATKGFLELVSFGHSSVLLIYDSETNTQAALDIKLDYTLTKKLLNKLIPQYLAPQTHLHGVMMQIYQWGVLLTGKAGIGKSTQALRLLQRGHQLVCDDAPYFYPYDNGIFSGCLPRLQGLIYTRKSGLLQIDKIYGKKAFLKHQRLDLIVELIDNSRSCFFRRNTVTQQVHNVSIPVIRLSLAMSRNTTMLIENAVYLSLRNIKNV